MKKFNPAAFVVRQFGGTRATARALNMSTGSIHYWTRSKAKRGAGGRIPATSHKRILKAAKKFGVWILPQHLVVPVFI